MFYAHKLKGSFAFVGAKKLEELALETEANPSNSDLLASNFASIVKLSEMAGAELHDILQKMGA